MAFGIVGAILYFDIGGNVPVSSVPGGWLLAPAVIMTAAWVGGMLGRSLTPLIAAIVLLIAHFYVTAASIGLFDLPVLVLLLVALVKGKEDSNRLKVRGPQTQS